MVVYLRQKDRHTDRERKYFHHLSSEINGEEKEFQCSILAAGMQ